MATYLIARERDIIRQAGDKAEFQFYVPAVIDMAGKGIEFIVTDSNGNVLINKSGSDVTINGQFVTIPFIPEDTQEQVGKHRWSVAVTDTDGPIHIGKGMFEIQAV